MADCGQLRRELSRRGSYGSPLPVPGVPSGSFPAGATLDRLEARSGGDCRLEGWAVPPDPPQPRLVALPVVARPVVALPLVAQSGQVLVPPPRAAWTGRDQGIADPPLYCCQDVLTCARAKLHVQASIWPGQRDGS